VFLIQLSTQFVNTTQIACPTNLVSQKTNNLEAKCFEDFFLNDKKINSIKEPSKFFSLSIYIL
jgi:hypothetical protein